MAAEQPFLVSFFEAKNGFFVINFKLVPPKMQDEIATMQNEAAISDLDRG